MSFPYSDRDYGVDGGSLEEFAKEFNAKLEEVEAAFVKLEATAKSSLEAVIEPILRRISEREKLIDEEMMGDEEIRDEHEEEDRKLLPHLEALFPFVAAANEGGKGSYIIAFLEYFRRRQHIQ